MSKKIDDADIERYIQTHSTTYSNTPNWFNTSILILKLFLYGGSVILVLGFLGTVIPNLAKQWFGGG